MSNAAIAKGQNGSTVSTQLSPAAAGGNSIENQPLAAEMNVFLWTWPEREAP